MLLFLLAIAIIIAAAAAAMKMSGGSDVFFKNYAYNFQKNAQVLAGKANIKLPEFSFNTSFPDKFSQKNDRSALAKARSAGKFGLIHLNNVSF